MHQSLRRNTPHWRLSFRRREKLWRGKRKRWGRKRTVIKCLRLKPGEKQSHGESVYLLGNKLITNIFSSSGRPSIQPSLYPSIHSSHSLSLALSVSLSLKSHNWLVLSLFLISTYSGHTSYVFTVEFRDRSDNELHVYLLMFLLTLTSCLICRHRSVTWRSSWSSSGRSWRTRARRCSSSTCSWRSRGRRSAASSSS